MFEIDVHLRWFKYRASIAMFRKIQKPLVYGTEFLVWAEVFMSFCSCLLCTALQITRIIMCPDNRTVDVPPLLMNSVELALSEPVFLRSSQC